jgi:hypothetical protein
LLVVGHVDRGEVSRIYQRQACNPA